MVPSIIRLLIPVTSKHFRNTQFHKLGTIYLHQRRANFAGLLMATNEVVRRHDMQAWTHTEHVTLPRALGHPWGKSSYIFYEKFIAHTSKLQTLESGRGSPQRCGYLQDSAMCHRPKNFWGKQKWPNEKCRDNLQHEGGQVTQGGSRLPKGRGDSSKAIGRLMPRNRAV